MHHPSNKQEQSNTEYKLNINIQQQQQQQNILRQKEKKNVMNLILSIKALLCSQSAIFVTVF